LFFFEEGSKVKSFNYPYEKKNYSTVFKFINLFSDLRIFFGQCTFLPIKYLRSEYEVEKCPNNLRPRNSDTEVAPINDFKDDVLVLQYFNLKFKQH
jgi:hypothetical protein